MFPMPSCPDCTWITLCEGSSKLPILPEDRRLQKRWKMQSSSSLRDQEANVRTWCMQSQRYGACSPRYMNLLSVCEWDYSPCSSRLWGMIAAFHKMFLFLCNHTWIGWLQLDGWSNSLTQHAMSKLLALWHVRKRPVDERNPTSMIA